MDDIYFEVRAFDLNRKDLSGALRIDIPDKIKSELLSGGRFDGRRNSYNAILEGAHGPVKMIVGLAKNFPCEVEFRLIVNLDGEPLRIRRIARPLSLNRGSPAALEDEIFRRLRDAVSVLGNPSLVHSPAGVNTQGNILAGIVISDEFGPGDITVGPPHNDSEPDVLNSGSPVQEVPASENPPVRQAETPENPKLDTTEPPRPVAPVATPTEPLPNSEADAPVNPVSPTLPNPQPAIPSMPEQSSLQAKPLPQIYMRRQTMERAKRHAQDERTRETGGVLLGRVLKHNDNRRTTIVVTGIVRGSAMIPTTSSLTFTPTTWAKVWQLIDRDPDYSDDKVWSMVGWYHTHPTFGIFLSSYDKFIHREYFRNPTHLALVIDPVRHEDGFFCWNGSQEHVIPCKHRELDEEATMHLLGVEVLPTAEIIERPE